MASFDSEHAFFVNRVRANTFRLARVSYQSSLDGENAQPKLDVLMPIGSVFMLQV